MPSRHALTLLLLGLLCASTVFVPVAADDDGADAENAGNAGASDDATQEAGEYRMPEHPLTNPPAAASDVRTQFILPDVANNVFTIGEVGVIVVGFQNNGAKLYNVSAIFGSLNSPFNSKMFIQNFTGRAYGKLVEGGADATFEYRFMPAPDLEPMDLQMAFTVFYEDDAAVYSNTFFNHTVTFETKTSAFDFRSTLRLIFILGLAGAIAAIFRSGINPSGARKTKKKSAPATPTAVKGEFAEEFKQRNSRSRSAEGRAKDE